MMSPTAPVPLDLDAYLARIGFGGNGRLDLHPDLELLEILQQAHATHIPFENLDVLLGRPIRLDLEGLQAKLVRGGRGGYCFEHNTLFAAVLERLGYALTRLSARVRLGANEVRPRTHMLLRVDLQGGAYLADVGFGGEMLLKPLPLVPDREIRVLGRAFRLLEDAGQWVLQSLHGEGWFDLYAFTLEPQFPVDFEVANHFTATHPSSLFLQHAFANRTTPEASSLLLDRKLSIRRGDEVTSRMIEDDDELLRVLAETFGLHFPPGTRFPSRTAPLDMPLPGR